jgi:ABC-type xylose transport system permease subunit
MTHAQKQTYLGIPAAVLALAGVLFWLGNAAFVSDAELAPVKARVDSLSTAVGTIQRDVRLSVCLQLAEKQASPWEACLQERGR